MNIKSITFGLSNAVSRVLFSGVFATLLSSLSTIYFARELGPAPLGAFFMFQASGMAASVLSDIGTAGAVEKRISEGRSLNKILSSGIVISVITTILLAVLVLYFSGVINSYFGYRLSHLLLVFVAIQQLSSLVVHSLKGEKRVGETAELDLVRHITWVVSGVILVSIGESVFALVYASILGSTIALIRGLQKLSFNLVIPDIENIRSLLHFGRYNMISSVGGLSHQWLDIFVISILLSPFYVGVYEVAWRIAKVVMLPSKSISSFIIPEVSSLWEEGQFTKVEEIVSRSITPSVFIILPSIFGSLIVGDALITLVFGSEFSQGSFLLLILLIERLVDSVYRVVGRALQGINKPRFAAQAMLFSVVLNLFLNLGLVMEFGIMGAALATLMSFTANLYLHHYYLSRYIDINYPTKSIVWMISASIGMLVILYFFRSIVPITNILGLIAHLTVGVACYVIFTLPSTHMRRQISDIIYNFS